MLIEVCDDVLKTALRPSENDNTLAVEALRHLAWSIRRNHHLVFFPTLSLDIIGQLEKVLNEKEIAAIKYSFSKKLDLQKIAGIVQFRMKVSFETATQRVGDTIMINPGEDNQFELFEECHLLVENLLDSEFFRYFAIVFQKNNRIDECAFRTTHYALQGGGTTTKQVFLYECGLGQHLCLAILDSDKKWPNYSGFGQTAKTFEDEYNRFVSDRGIPVSSHYYIMNEVNEIENLIPNDILCEFSSPSQKSFIKKHSAALPWFDIKKGLEYRLLFENKEALKEWKRVFPDDINWTQLSSIISSSTSVSDFEIKKDNAGFKPIVNPWGASILERVLHPDKKHQGKFKLQTVDLSRFSKNQREEWDKIGRLVFNWCCCFGKRVY